MNISEIERKFLVRELPDISGIPPVRYERFYIRREPTIEERVQRKGDVYEYERKETLSNLESKKEKREITQEEFAALKPPAGDAIIRDSYLIGSIPSVSLKIYRGQYEGLVRAEVEFTSIEEARAFEPLPWMGTEITDTPLGRDRELLDLPPEQFATLLRSYS